MPLVSVFFKYKLLTLKSPCKQNKTKQNNKQQQTKTNQTKKNERKIKWLKDL